MVPATPIGAQSVTRHNVPWLLALILTACSSSDSTGPTATNAVDVRDNLFSPSAVTVTREATVTWTWRGSDIHNVVFEDGQGSSTQKASGTHVRVFTGVGVFRYRCTLHSTSFTSGMVGYVQAQLPPLPPL